MRTTSTVLAILLLPIPSPPRAQGDEVAVTFTEHVAPIVFAHCAQCHRPGEVAPFPLLSYEDVRKRGKTIARVTQKRYMPPWHPVEGHGEFAGSLRLGDEQIETLRRWVEGGMPEGDPAKLPALPKFTDGWQLGEPDLVVRMPKGFEVPAQGPDLYRSFAIPLGLDEDRWLTAIEVRPSARSVLHHIVFTFDEPGSPRSGMRGFRALGSAALGGWAVGGMPRELPLGLARHVPKGAALVLNSHFHPSGKPEVEQTTIGLHFTERAPTRSLVPLQLPPLFGAVAGLSVKAGQKDFELRDEFTLPVAAEAIEVGGHAHMICTQMQVWITPPGGERRSIFWIDDWDFDWQNRYQYAAPVPLPAGTKVEVALRYDNSADNPDNPFDPPRDIRWGRESTDEMGSVTLLLVAQDEQDAPALQRAIREHTTERVADGRMFRGLGGAALARVRQLDTDGDGRIDAAELERLPERSRELVLRLDTDGDGAIDQDELRALDRLGRRRRDR
jgi:mono/diheme cytochrome c family protein